MLRSLTTKSKYYLILVLVLASFLRLWGLSRVPVSLFSDEVDVGYQTYSILRTGKDYMGNSFPFYFQSYSDFRTPLYIYASIPTVALFGISPLGVRLPAAIFGILGVLGMYLFIKELISYELAATSLKDRTRNALTRNGQTLALISSLVIALSPWHLQYSRAAFEVTMLLAFYLFGLYFFFRSLKQSKNLWISVLLLTLTPLIYSTAKLFTPMLLIVLFILWHKEILRFPKKRLITSAVAGLIVGLPIILSTLFAGGTARFNYISVFSDPTTGPEIDYARLLDAQVRDSSTNIVPKIISHLVHNKPVYWGSRIINNYFQAVSTDFLFINGDPNLRHSISGIGGFYKVEMITLILGMVFFFNRFGDKKIKLLILSWIILGILPSAITRDGGNHATRLILILPPLVFLISYGILFGLSHLKINIRRLLATIYILLFATEFGFYLHNYWVHNPRYSERQWHAGFYEMVEGVRQLQGSYQKVVISDKYEPPKIFFAGFYQYPPKDWQGGFEKTSLPGFDYLEKVGKFYFGHEGPISINELSAYMEDSTLYIASSAEVPDNLLREPQKTPSGISLIKSVFLPSGEPIFYFFIKGGS